jgi:hypothetical protein
LKRRETKSGQEEAGHTALVRACSRWLTFARTLSRGRGRRLAVADTLAFIETLYGGRFRAVEGGAFSLDKIYRTSGGGLFVSETRLSVSVHPRFDLRLTNVAGHRAVSQVFREAPLTTVFNLLSHASVSDREQPHAALQGANSVGAAPWLTVQTWSVLPAGAERLQPAFGYVNVRGQRVRQAQGLESARPTARAERPGRGDVLTGTSAETSRQTVASAPASLRLTSIDLRRSFIHAPRQEFVSVLLNTYLPAVESRESLSARTTSALSVASPRRATAQSVTERRFAPAPGMPERRPSAWTYAEPAPRHVPGAAVEMRTEFRSAERVKVHAASARDPRPPLLQVLPPASLLLSLSGDFLTVFAGGGAAAGHTTYYQSGRATEMFLQHLGTHTQSEGTREVLSPPHTLVERVHSTVAGITHAGHSTVFTRPGFEQASARKRGASSEAAPRSAASRDLLSRSVVFVRPEVEAVRPASAAVFTREASAHDASTHDANIQIQLDRAPGGFATRGAPGAGTFLFATALLRRTTGASTAGALSPKAATFVRPAAAVETARAARPEGMALELIRHRREEVLRLPQPGYVFTQPARTQLEERQVITKASREEIVEVVRREVRSLAALPPAPAAASRADLAGLADEVYSTLVRRLLVEKERLGRF